MAEISLCMIVRDEQETLSRCLDSVKEAVDEIIIVDTGSRDRTLEIAGRYTPHVFQFPWQDDFSAARNQALAHVTRQFWMWLDADDILWDVDALVRLKQHALQELDLVMAPYHVAFDLQERPTFTYYRERIMRTAMGFRWEGAVHEAVTPAGRIGYGDFSVCHHKHRVREPGRNLRIYERLQREGHSFSPRERFYYGRELRDAGRLEEGARQLQKVAEDEAAWLENRIEACLGWADCLEEMGDTNGAKYALCKSLALDAPRARIACELGKRFLAKGNLSAARFWYEAALGAEEDEKKGAFAQKDAAGYIPLMQLCVIYDRLGQRDKAVELNERAGQLKPEDPSVLWNRRYFEGQQP